MQMHLLGRRFRFLVRTPCPNPDPCRPQTDCARAFTLINDFSTWFDHDTSSIANKYYLLRPRSLASPTACGSPPPPAPTSAPARRSSTSHLPRTPPPPPSPPLPPLSQNWERGRGGGPPGKATNAALLLCPASPSPSRARSCNARPSAHPC